MSDGRVAAGRLEERRLVAARRRVLVAFSGLVLVQAIVAPIWRYQRIFGAVFGLVRIAGPLLDGAGTSWPHSVPTEHTWCRVRPQIRTARPLQVVFP